MRPANCRDCGSGIGFDESAERWAHQSASDCPDPVPTMRWLAEEIGSDCAADAAVHLPMLDVDDQVAVAQSVAAIVSGLLLSVQALAGIIASMLPPHWPAAAASCPPMATPEAVGAWAALQPGGVPEGVQGD